jgi:hypothetical protein
VKLHIIHDAMLNHYPDPVTPCQENVLRFERLNEDLTNLGARYGIHIPPLPRVNESERPRFKVEDLDADTRSLIESTFAKDFDLLGFKRIQQASESMSCS